MADLTVIDPVAEGLREWHRVRQHDAESTERAERAEKEADFLRGQMAVLQSQEERNAQELKQLRGQVEEMKMHVAEGAAIFADLMTKMRAGAFRKPGSREVIAKAPDGVAEIAAKHGADNPRTFAPSAAHD